MALRGNGMTWRAFFKGKEQGQRDWTVTLYFQDDAGNTSGAQHTLGLAPTDAVVQSLAIGDIGQLQSLKDVGGLTLQPGDEISLTMNAAPIDPAKAARQQYNAAVQTYRVLLDQTALGMPVDPAATASAQKAAQALWLDSYAGIG